MQKLKHARARAPNRADIKWPEKLQTIVMLYPITVFNRKNGWFYTLYLNENAEVVRVEENPKSYNPLKK